MFEPDEVGAWLDQPITAAFFAQISDIIAQTDESVRIHVVADRMHEAKMCAGIANGMKEVFAVPQYLITGGVETDESENGGA